MKLTGFEGKGAFVTGAAGGIGCAIVDALADAGAQVYATDLPDAIAALPDRPGVVKAALDVTDPDAVSAAVAQAEATVGPLYHGIVGSGILTTGSMLDTSAADWRRVVDVNLHGTFFVTTALAKTMVPRQQGAIVAIGSNSADIPRLQMGAYPASKAALHMHMRCLGLELAPFGIRCNIVAPGSTRTPMQTGMWSDPQDEQRVIGGNLATYKTGIPLKKLAKPEDIAASTIFLLSDQAGHVTMADLYVDGGATLKA